MIKGVIFDMGGLLIDSEIMCYKGYQNYLNQNYKIFLSLEEYCLLFAGRSMIAGLENAKEYYNLEYDTQEAITLIQNDNIRDIKANKVPLKPGVEALLAYLKKHHYKIAMATSSGKERVHNLLDDYHILDFFDALVTAGDVNKGKPHPDVFLKACELLCISNEEALVLEDADSGIEAAYKGHIKVIQIPDLKEATHKEYCEAILPTLHEVIEYLENHNMKM